MEERVTNVEKKKEIIKTSNDQTRVEGVSYDEQGFKQEQVNPNVKKPVTLPFQVRKA